MKILIAEDDVVSRCLLEELLASWSHEVLVAEDGEAALALVKSRARFDVAILDWMMPGVAGVDVCKHIRGAGAERHPYVLMLTAKSQLEDIVNGLDAGADEYLTKPYRPAELAARLRAAARYLRVQDDLIGAQRIVTYQAEHDILTGALNRATFLSRVHAVIAERKRRPRPLSVLRVDVAGLSRINEQHGIGVGDEVLRAVVERLRGAATGIGALGRHGADDFLVLLPDADEEEAAIAARSLARAVRSPPIPTQAGPIPVTVDVGVVTAGTPPELDLGWVLCAIDAIRWIGARGDRASSVELAVAS